MVRSIAALTNTNDTTMNTFEELKQEAIALGIVPGAKVKVPYLGDEVFTVAPFHYWKHHDENLRAASDDTSDGLVYIFISGQWATVITPAPEDQQQGLVDGMACEPDEHMRAAIVAKSVEIGSSSGKHPIWGKYFYWDAQEYKLLQGDDTKSNPIPPGEFYDRLCRTSKPEPPICIGDYHVTFNNGSIQVGCTTVPNDIVRKVAERLKD